MLSHLLHQHGIASVVLEAKESQLSCEERVRAGVLEHTSVEMLRNAGVAERLEREGLRHEGIELGLHGRLHRIPFVELTGKAVTVYGQQEVVKDLIARRLSDGGDVRFECGEVSLHDLEGSRPWIRMEKQGNVDIVSCDYVAGCDGFHGISRSSFPSGALTIYDRSYPFAWLGILAEAAPSREELVYMHHERGFALYSMRSPRVTRLYLQCKPDEDLAGGVTIAFGANFTCVLDAPMAGTQRKEKFCKRASPACAASFVEPLQFGRLFLAGDAAHIVPPTGAKGMNLALADVHYLAESTPSKVSREGW